MIKRLVLFTLLLLLVACSPDSSNTVTLIVDGETRTLHTEALTVRELLSEAGVTLDGDDRVEPVETTFVAEEMTVRVIRVETWTETEEIEIPFERRTVRDATIPVGETRLLEPGITGIEERTFRVTAENGVEVDRQLLRSVVVQEPRTEVVLKGVQVDIPPVPITGTLAYISQGDAWVMRTTSPNRRRLTSTGDLDHRVFSLSPDGTHLLFTRSGGAEEEEEPEGSSPLNTLWMIETVTADAEPIRLEIDGVLWADWSPECSGTPSGFNCRIAYSTGMKIQAEPGWKAENDLYIASPRASNGRLLDERRILRSSAGGAYGWWGTTFAWSPDGERIAYAQADEVGVIDLSQRERVPLAEFAPYRTFARWAWVPTIDWSADGSLIVTTLHGPSSAGEAPEDSPVFDVWALSAQGTITAELVSEAGMWAVPEYDPTGSTILFERARSPYASHASGYDLYVIDSDGSDRERLFPPEGEIGLEYRPHLWAWGPGGDRFVVIYQGNLYQIEFPEGEALPLTGEGGVTAVRWAW